MSSPSAGCVEQLKAVLPHRVHLPETDDYHAALGRVFFPEASRRRPSCVVEPVSVDEVSTVMRVAHRTGGTVTVRGGGLSSNCVADDAVMLDLSAALNTARPEGDRVVVAGGATVGTMLDALAPTGRVVPVGIVGHAGFGLVTRGGVGYLTRSLGLTLDQLVEVELVLPSGEVVHLSDASTGDEADLWWAVRGCAPCFGVVTSAVLRTHPQGPVWVDRMVLGIDSLATYFRVAPTLPRNTTMGAVLGYSALSADEPILFVYTACASSDAADIDRARAAADAVAGGSGNVLYRSETSGTYLGGLPEFAPPGLDGEEPEPIRLPEPGEPRGSFFGKAVFTGATLDSHLAEALATQIRGAPTRECRIDFQHTGGALADVGDEDTAFWGRSGEWNIPLNAIWSDPYYGAACLSWAGGTLDALAPHTTGVYSVEVRPGFPETGAEINAAYGGNLRRLRELRQRHDPMGVLTHYPL
ncbi:MULTISPECIES: FAD-binding oxidoreductase [unclassified Rhodococcus (in: high G+C Gram-positive bacteria)]|uniref:FAD-binding oxidoreductase n=1 Tax=unclassified Rhodococcus (in: high G+C Gram-positive bacteria) TaxID=192944 RepID=UPI00163989B2|nr:MULTISPECIES: FAD-binding oxidoreductase [unclassified Rhodococcus (in: high G+C Gram-positive bacteria)]MBC2640216.1 FAD-binding oxidoreductase [Rhodococcus sp. 3A]MBC2895038.1 FAD-binding oxidoreductase [Rhodococcus sp. 4CII]